MRFLALVLCCCAVASAASRTTVAWTADMAAAQPQTITATATVGQVQRQPALSCTFAGPAYSHVQINWCNWQADHPKAITPTTRTVAILRCRLLPGSRPQDVRLVCFGPGEVAAQRQPVALSAYGTLSDQRWCDIQIPLADMSKTGDLGPLGTPLTTMIISTYGTIPGGLLVHSLRFKQ